MNLFYDKICNRCGQVYQPLIGPRQQYCGSRKLKFGCSWLVREEHRLRALEKAKAARAYKKFNGSILTAELKENHLVPEECSCGRRFIRTPNLNTCLTCRLKTRFVS